LNVRINMRDQNQCTCINLNALSAETFSLRHVGTKRRSSGCDTRWSVLLLQSERGMSAKVVIGVGIAIFGRDVDFRKSKTQIRNIWIE